VVAAALKALSEKVWNPHWSAPDVFKIGREAGGQHTTDRTPFSRMLPSVMAGPV